MHCVEFAVVFVVYGVPHHRQDLVPIRKNMDLRFGLVERSRGAQCLSN